MMKKLKKKNNDSFSVKTMNLVCACYDPICTNCPCVATESTGTDRYDTTYSEKTVVYAENYMAGKTKVSNTSPY